MQRQRKFTKKNTVRFHLVPGTDEKGNPTIIYEPVEPMKTKLSQKQRKKIINQISGYEIQIDGKPIDESEIPAFVLEQIKGRADLIFHQKNPELFKAMDEMQEQQMEEQGWQQQGQQIPQQQYMDAEPLQPIATETPKQVQIDGSTYSLTPTQLQLLNEVLPENYENYKIEGIEFKKYNEDGIDINNEKQVQNYKRYIANPQEKRAIIDSYQYRPEVPVDVVDNDLDGVPVKGQMKELDDALEYEGEDGAYQEIEDDFFAKLISGQTKTKKQVKQTPKQQAFKKKKSEPQPTTQPVVQKKKQQPLSKLDMLEGDDDYYEDNEEEEYEDNEEDYEDEDEEDYEDEQQITDEMLDKALQEFNKRKDEGKKQEQKQEENVKWIPGTGVPVDKKGQELCNFIESRQQCIGRDGQLDWRTLTKKQKREYMKNKKIRQIYEQVREREIQQKLKDKKNVTAQELHLKKYIKHIPYVEDHVMQQSIKRDQQQIVNLQETQNDEDYETDSDEDDIISYRAKTSIISSNLATVEDKIQRKKKKEAKDEEEKDQEIKNIQKVKVVPEKRNRNQTAEERKERKQKLKQMKKQKKDQRKQFNQVFEGQRKKVIRRDNNTNNPLYKVPYVKIV